MEFFSWMGIPQAFLSLWNFEVDENATIGDICAAQMQILVISLCVAAGLFLLGHLFGGFGLYKLAKRAGDKFAWMAFVPILNTYLSGRLAGETKVFGVKCKRIGLYGAIVEALFIALNVYVLILQMLMLNSTFYTVEQTAVGTDIYLSLTMKELNEIPRGYQWMSISLNVVDIIEIVWYFVTLVTFIMLYSAFFRKYYARSPFTMAFLCSFFPVRGYVLFAVRNNAAIDYDQWMQANIRRMQQQQAQQYGGPQPPYGGSYGGNSYGGPQGDEPFSDVSGTNDSTNGGTPPDSNEPFSDL